ncbi:MAG: DUF433 domain-containing protein [Caldilineaceae bacterium]|nr:DUF433 domain-containing protein [Caldilineaceae bacterium]MCB0143015.1 DUF433 domain-containing protein [Caldilineaceae bacterium]
MTDKFHLHDNKDAPFQDDEFRGFLQWIEGLGADPDVMGGAETFPNSRLTVRHVGEILERGVDVQEILEDYPYLSGSDLEFARLFVRVYSVQEYTNLELHAADLDIWELLRLKQVLANFFARKAIDETDIIWDEQNLSDETTEAWLNKG